MNTPKNELNKMNPWHSTLVDFFRKRIPPDSSLRPYAKRIVEDSRSLLRTFHRWKYLEDQPPNILSVETTNICNANCIFCAYQYQDRFRQGKGVMHKEVFEKVLAEYRQMGGATINMTSVAGEPLVDAHMTHRIRRSKQEGFSVLLYTNGILLNQINLEDFVAAGVDCLFLSTAPFDRRAHQLLYRTEKYDDLLQGVCKLLKLRNERDVKMHISILYRSHISMDRILALPDFQTYIRPHLSKGEIESMYAQVRSFDSWGGQITQEALIGKMQLAQAPRLKYRPCLWTFHMMVLYDGKVRACSCRYAGTETRDGCDELFVGDIRQNPLAEIWRGEAIRRVRRRFVAGQLPAVCRSCTMYRPV